MKRVTGADLASLQPFFEQAAQVATRAKCQRAKCGTVIVKDGIVIGEGYNGPALDDESRRTCGAQWDTTLKPKYDKTCCIHAEWRAILDACKHNGNAVTGSTLVFMRVDDDGNFTDAGEPYCTVCSRLTMESGVSQFVLWNNDGADVYSAAEYDAVSYNFYAQ